MTVSRVLHQSKLSERVAARKKAHINSQLESEVNWKKLLWSDETNIELVGHESQGSGW